MVKNHLKWSCLFSSDPLIEQKYQNAIWSEQFISLPPVCTCSKRQGGGHYHWTTVRDVVRVICHAFLGSSMTSSEAGRCGPRYGTTRLVPADAFTVHRRGWPSGCTAEHRNINMAQTQPGPWDYLQGKQDRLLSLWKTETHCRQGDQCKQSKKMLCRIKRQFDSLLNSGCGFEELRRLSRVLAPLREGNRWVFWGASVGGEERKCSNPFVFIIQTVREMLRSNEE